MKQVFFAAMSMMMMSLFACSPSYRPFTTDLQSSQGWSEQDLKKIQFYTSRDIVLQRELSSGESVIDGGKIILREGRRIEEVVIPEKTPGVLEFMPRSNRMAISFERGKNRFLMFGPNPNSDGKYMLLGSSWDRNSGTISYQGKSYSTSSRSAYAGLMVDLERASKVTMDRHTASGRTVRK